MGGWREVSISQRPVTSSDLKQEGSFFPRTVSTFLQLFVWVVTLLESYDVTNNGRHLTRHLGFHQELEIR